MLTASVHPTANMPRVLENVMREAAEPPEEAREFGWDVDWDNGVDHSHSD